MAPDIRMDIAQARDGMAVAARSANATRIVNLSELSPAWSWVGDAFRRTYPGWKHVSSQSFKAPAWTPRPATIARLRAGWQAARTLGDGPSVLVSHGPRPAIYGSLMTGRRFPHMRHLAFSFNYTDLPEGMTRRLTAHFLRRVERFVVFSTLERELYAGHFDLPPDRFDMLHWGARPPAMAAESGPSERGNYICALGSQGRDYATLMHAMKRLPKLRLVVVATPDSLSDIVIPSNVTVRTDIPLEQAMNILAHSRFMVLPLKGGRTPCGHVTVVSAMHLGKAIIATHSAGLADYVEPRVNALTCQPNDHAAWAGAIQSLHDDPNLSMQFGLAGQRFASRYCTEKNVVDYLRQFLRSSPGGYA